MNAPFTLPLDGEWRLDFFPQPADGAVRSLPLPCPAETVAATIPGCCELDLARSGLLPEPEVGLNDLAWRKYEGHQWLFSRSFLFRVNGEPDAFYDWCDEHGLLVWQDFMTGCAQFPQDDAYAAATADEVRTVALRLRNHASLALWAGNNEIDASLAWSPRLGSVALAPEPGLIDIDYAVDDAAPERSHYLRGEPPFRRADIQDM